MVLLKTYIQNLSIRVRRVMRDGSSEYAYRNLRETNDELRGIVRCCPIHQAASNAECAQDLQYCSKVSPDIFHGEPPRYVIYTSVSFRYHRHEPAR